MRFLTNFLRARGRKFAEGLDILTVEIEHIDADALEEVARELDVDVEPTPATLRLIQVPSHTGSLKSPP